MSNKKLAPLLFLAAIVLAAYLFCLPHKLFDAPVCAVLESSDGTLLGARIAEDGQWRFPPSDSVPEKFAKAITTYEDKRFRHHPGVDMLALGRAVKLNLSSGEVRSGASTITMQVIRMSRGNKRRTFTEKMVEAVLATRLELRCSKDRILAMYASNAPFGGNVVGLQAASWRYFGKEPEDLSWAESATLAVLPNSPALIHPGKNRQALLEKRDFLLEKLCSAGIIDRMQCDLAKDEPLPDKPHAMPDICHHYLETLRAREGDRLFRSSIDADRQLRAEGVLARHAAVFESNNVFNIAAVALDVRTGEPVIYCGNVRRGGNAHGEAVDVVKAARSSGSTLKPFLYAAMLDEGMLMPQTLVADVPFHYKDFSPSNFNHTFDGAVTAQSVIRRSLNVPSVRMLHEYGTERFISLLHKLGFTTINRSAEDYGLSLILGGAEIRLSELAEAYRSLALELVEYAEDPSSRKEHVIGPGAAWCTFDALTEVSRPEEEGSWHSFSSSRTVAWKTGTSYGNRDAWSVGVTPDYVVAVWVGNCDNTGRPLLTGVGYAAPVMFDIFGILPMGGWFDAPAGDLTERIICSRSGYPAAEACAGELDTVTVPNVTLRMESCPFHRFVHLDAKGEYQVDSDCCSISEMVTVPWFVLPPAQEWYYIRSHGDYRKLPPMHPKMAGYVESQSIQIIYPQSGMQIATPVSMGTRSRGAVFSAAHSDPGAVIYWHLDGEYLGMTSHGEHKIKVVPEPGAHTLTVLDANGNSASVRFTAK